MSEVITPRLMAAAKEFNIGTNTLIDFLVSKGISEELKPTTKLTETMYRILQSEFKQDKVAHEKAMQIDMAVAMAEMLEAAGYQNVRTNINMSFPGNANHEMGSARMGEDPKTSVLNAYNQMHEVKNVFITDGSFMTSSGCVNPSLTYMALTARACDYAVKEMNRNHL